MNLLAYLKACFLLQPYLLAYLQDLKEIQAQGPEVQACSKICELHPLGHLALHLTEFSGLLAVILVLGQLGSQVQEPLELDSSRWKFQLGLLLLHHVLPRFPALLFSWGSPPFLFAQHCGIQVQEPLELASCHLNFRLRLPFLLFPAPPPSRWQGV